MHIELISIGTELLNGYLNSNSAYIGEKLAAIGLSLNLVSTVGDDKKYLENIFKQAFTRSDIIITTGGLGPTFDDLTREVMAKALNLKLIFNKEAMQTIAEYFAKKEIEMPEKNERQAYILEGAKILVNTVGTAPGMLIVINNKVIIMLPGPPQEMKPMMIKNVLPLLKERYENKIGKSIVLHTCGLAELELEDKISDLVQTREKLENINFGIQAHPSLVDVKVSVNGEDEMLVDQTLHKIKTELYSYLGENIYGENQDTLEKVIGNLLGKHKLSLAIAESCSGGLIANRITNIPGSSIYFKLGVIAYSNESKVNILGINKNCVDEFGAVSKEVALSMAEGIKKSAQSHIGLATTGIAGPAGGMLNKPVGLVFIALVSDKKRICKEYKFIGDRKNIKENVANVALDLLRRYIVDEHR